MKLDGYDGYTISEMENDYIQFIFTNDYIEQNLLEFQYFKQALYDEIISVSEFLDYLSFNMHPDFWTKDGHPIERYEDGSFEIHEIDETPIDTFNKVYHNKLNIKI